MVPGLRKWRFYQEELILRLKGTTLVQNLDARTRGKVAVFHGRDPAIDGVIERRVRDPACRQVPHGHASVPSRYEVQIRYTVDHDGFVAVTSVDVRFATHASRRWSIFFDRATERRGEIVRRNHAYHFLDDDGVEKLAAFLTRFEDRAALMRLTLRGPASFPLSSGRLRDDPETLRRCIPVDIDEPEEPLPDQD